MAQSRQEHESGRLRSPRQNKKRDGEKQSVKTLENNNEESGGRGAVWEENGKSKIILSCVVLKKTG